LEQLFGEPTIAIHRADLHNVLLSALPPDALCLNLSYAQNGPDAACR